MNCLCIRFVICIKFVIVKKNINICLLIKTKFNFNYGKSNYTKKNYGKCNYYGKCNLWQVWLMASVTYGKCIMANVIMAKIIIAKILWQMKLSPLLCLWIFKRFQNILRSSKNSKTIYSKHWFFLHFAKFKNCARYLQELAKALASSCKWIFSGLKCNIVQ